MSKTTKVRATGGPQEAVRNTVESPHQYHCKFCGHFTGRGVGIEAQAGTSRSIEIKYEQTPVAFQDKAEYS